MPLIKIVEQDLTTPGVLAQENDVVYIPGFVDTTQDNLNDENGYIGIEAFKPTYFSDVKAFESLCGKRGAKFDSTQYYTDLITKNPDGTYSGFAANAIPQHRVMFYEETIDPSYIMAKELLNAGLSIVYERINRDADFIQLNEKPEDWETSYSSYYVETDMYTPIANPVAPEIFKKHYEGETGSRTVTYYSLSIEDNGDSKYIPVEASDVLNIEQKFTKSCYSLNPEKYYRFTHPQDTVNPQFSVESDGTAKYYTLKATKKTFKTDTKTADTYFTKDKENENNYVLDSTETITEGVEYYTLTAYPLLEEPAEWGDMDAYERVIDSEKITGYNKINFNDELEFNQNTWYIKDKNIGYTLLDKEPETFTPNLVYSIEEYPKADDKNCYTINSDWVKEFANYCEKTSVKKVVEADAENNVPTFPTVDEEGNTGIYKISYFIDISTAYEALAKVFNSSRDQGIADMGSVNIKYLTSGGYPVYEYNNNSLVNAMKGIATTRGDCVAFIDHTNNPYRTTNVNLAESLYATVKADDGITSNGEFATMFTPWMNFTRVTTDANEGGEESPTTIQMSATYGYLLALADSLKTNASWLAVAGATRGQVPNLAQVATPTPITNGTADAMQPRDAVSINAITEINPYGQTIWGNRTLKNNAREGNLTATSFLNIRHLVSDIKKVCYSTARALTFEQNNDILWINFKSKISPTLDKMVSGYGISGYKIVRDTEHEKAAEKATLCAKIILYPTYAVEDFYITIVLTDDEVGVSE